MEEAETAKNDIKQGLESVNFDEINKAAHRLKGSAAYLGCEAMRDSMMTIQYESKKGTSMDEAQKQELLSFLQKEYDGFLVKLKNLQDEVNNWFAKHK